jgi:hypothetical protein
MVSDGELAIALAAMKTSDWVEECQECAVGQTEAWKTAMRWLDERYIQSGFFTLEGTPIYVPREDVEYNRG